MKMAVFWDVAQCSLVEAYRPFRGACCLHHQCDDQPIIIRCSIRTVDELRQNRSVSAVNGQQGE
jgi:hypothetical protein